MGGGVRVRVRVRVMWFNQMSHLLWWGANAQTFRFKTLYGGQFMLSLSWWYHITMSMSNHLELLTPMISPVYSSLKNNLERSEFEARTRLGSQVETLQREVNLLKRKLESEDKHHKSVIDTWQVRNGYCYCFCTFLFSLWQLFSFWTLICQCCAKCANNYLCCAM